jgi:hypothetical protein
VSLEGSLQTVALPEVLDLLADTSKDGALRVSGGRWGGDLWFEAGKLTGFRVGRTTDPVDALFDLLRVEDGDFVFDAAATRPETAVRPEGGDPVDIKPVLETAQSRLEEWPEIVAVVPSLEHELSLVEECSDRGVRLEGDQWSLIVAIGEGRSVQAVLDKRELPEFAGCKSLKALVEADLVRVEAPLGASFNGGANGRRKLSLATFPTRPTDDHSDDPTTATTTDHEHDGLADRGPWTLGELTSLTNGETAEAGDTADAGAAAGDARSDAENGHAHAGDAPHDDTPAGDTETDAAADEEAAEPINRGLLLKFLSSVRS